MRREGCMERDDIISVFVNILLLSKHGCNFFGFLWVCILLSTNEYISFHANAVFLPKSHPFSLPLPLPFLYQTQKPGSFFSIVFHLFFSVIGVID